MKIDPGANFSSSNRWNRHLSTCNTEAPLGIDEADAFVASLFANGTVIKESKRSTLVRGQGESAGFIGKVYRTRKARYLIHAFVHGRGSLPAWSNICRLKALGIATLDPVFLLEHRFFRFPGESFLITREIQGENLSDYLQNNNGDITDTQLEKLHQMLKTFYAARLIHGDLNEDNIMITDSGPVMIDLDKLDRANTDEEFVSRFRPEKARFLRKLDPWPTGRDRISDIFPAID